MHRPASVADDEGLADAHQHRPRDPFLRRAQRQLRGRRDRSGETFISERAGLNFINILQVALTWADPKSAKNTVKLSSLFCTFGIFE